MSVILNYSVNIGHYPLTVDGTSVSGSPAILDTDGAVSTDGSGVCIGIMGDDTDTDINGTAYSAEVVVGAVADGATANRTFTQNRVSDLGNEAKASNKVTVYAGSGTDVWISADQLTTSAAGYVPGAFLTAASEKWLLDASPAFSDGAILMMTQADGSTGDTSGISYGGGVPGTDVDGHISLGDYVRVVIQ